MVYKISNENIAITEKDRLKQPLRQLRHIHSSFFKTRQQRQESIFFRRISDTNWLPQP